MHLLPVLPLADTMVPLIPIIGLFIPIVAIIANYLTRRDILKSWHEQRMAAIAKGVELPPNPSELTEGLAVRPIRPEAYLLGGLILLAIGGGLALVLWQLRSMMPVNLTIVGAVPGLIGLALVIFYQVAKAKTRA